jgi:hypothetical protein
VLVARQVDFGDLDAVRVAVEMTHNYLNLALENLAGGDLRTAVENLRDTHLVLLFRLGVSLTIDLKKRASDLMRRLGLDPTRSREVPYFDTPYREAIAGFTMRQPRFFGGLDGTGSVQMRDFRSMRDVHLGYAILDQIQAAQDLFKSLFSIDIASPGFRASMAGSGNDIRLSQILLTAFARDALDGRFVPEPVEASRLNALRDRIMTPNERPARLNDGFRDLVESTLDQKLDAGVRKNSAAFINSCLNILEEEFGSLDRHERIDARFMQSILLRHG